MSDLNANKWSTNDRQSYEKLQSYNDGHIEYSDYSPEYQAEVEESIKEIIEESTPKKSVSDTLGDIAKTINSVVIIVIFVIASYFLYCVLN